MTDLKRVKQRTDGSQTETGNPSRDENGPGNEGAEFGTHDRATRGKDGDLDRSGISKNQGHGHTREERG